jgi:hypothetical protein
VPLASSWRVAEKTRVVAKLTPDPINRSFGIAIIEGATEEEWAEARDGGTWAGGVRCPVDRDGKWLPLTRRPTTSADQIRGRAGLRLWENEDLAPRPGDVFQERLYCIRWVETFQVDDRVEIRRHYRAPLDLDLAREEKVLALLKERFTRWQEKGFIPGRRIEHGDKTDEPIRTRGWTHWHHLFHPRQLLADGLWAEMLPERAHVDQCSLLLTLGRMADYGSKMSIWNPKAGHEGVMNTFYNQALNCLSNYAVRPSAGHASLLIETPGCAVHRALVSTQDARVVSRASDVWITDPGYADAVNYEELSEFFIAWYDKTLTKLFPEWYSDSKRALAVKGSGQSFRIAMAECYQNLAAHTGENGFQVVTFTHQDPEIWSDLAIVLWAAGLQVSAAWTISTETGATALKQGNYVQGTVVLILRKRRSDRRGDFAEVFPEVEDEVARQIESMTAIDDRDDPNFGDADYQLAAYAAALRVLTSYARIEDVDVERELRRGKGEASPLVDFIGRTVRIASNALSPSGLDRDIWRSLVPEERFYLKGIDVEAKGERRDGVYQEFARGLGLTEYRGLLASSAANEVRLRTPSEFGGRDLGGDGFGGSLLRKVLYGIHATARDAERDPRPARDYFHREIPDYWGRRKTILALLRFLVERPKPAGGMGHWERDVAAGRLLLGAIENDHP